MPIELVPRLKDLLDVAADYNAGLHNTKARLEVEQYNFDIAVARHRKQRKHEALEAVKKPWLPQTNALFKVGNTLELAITALTTEIQGLREDIKTAAAQQDTNMRTFTNGVISEIRELRGVSDSLGFPWYFAG